MIREQYDDLTGLEIAVVGMSCKFPGIKNTEEYWNNLKNGVESITFFTDEELSNSGIDSELLNDPNYVKAKGYIEDTDYFDSSFFGYTPKETEVMDPQMRVFHECVWEALEDAGYDPKSYPKLIGLYAGASDNVDWKARVLLFGNEEVDSFSKLLLSNKDLMCTQIAYKLNLQGPVISIQSACSTSLLAIHLACQGLLSGECNIAIAGGVSVTLPEKSGYLYQKGMTEAPDGHCRAFDIKAEGTVFGNGAGAVILKTLEDALADGDNIYSIIKGSASNNDGNRKVGFTAPSTKGQSEVIKQALNVANVKPEDISYVEAHGTGTALGDPIEIESLKAAFNTKKRQYCRVGSVKTNLGHLDAAAGIAGFIKTTLALKNKQIPPSLNFETPNPKIDFANSPFFVNTHLTEWENNGSPLRAGVSSFGIGGTNVHIILEEAPKKEKLEDGKINKMLLFSAKTQTALDKMTQNFGEFLSKNPKINLESASNTLQVGRKVFEYKRAIVCTSVEEAIEAIQTNDPDKVQTFFSREKNNPIVFMFPGQGDQYVNMGINIFSTEPVFKSNMEKCFEIYHSITGERIENILYPLHDLEIASNRINITEITQPILFMYGYSLAKLLMNRGITPNSMIGYDFGEYIAACLSQVISLQDAIDLIVTRGRLMQSIPKGSMLSIPMREKELKPLLGDDISLTVDNGESCIVSGSIDAIQKLEAEMKNSGVFCMHINSLHAGHSNLMDSILDQFAEKVRKIQLKKPKIPYISSLSGDWIKNEEAINPEYWVKHLRNTVRFNKGLETLLEDGNSIFIEVGCGKALSSLINRHKNKVDDIYAINMTRFPYENVSDDFYLYKQIAKLWLCGAKIDWKKFTNEADRQRVSLPTYPFEKKFCGLNSKVININEVMLNRRNSNKVKDINEWFYTPSWNKSLPLMGDINSANKSTWVIFADKFGLGEKVAEKLKQGNNEVIIVKEGLQFSMINVNIYEISPCEIDDYKILINEIAHICKESLKIVHLWGVNKNSFTESRANLFKKEQELGFFSLINLVNAIRGKNLAKDIDINVVTNNLQDVLGNEEISFEKSTVLGACKVISQEYLNIVCRSIDILLSDLKPLEDERLIGELIKEFVIKSNDLVVAYRGYSRWVQIYKKLKFENQNDNKFTLRKQGVYLITGGLGNIGYEIAKYLAANFQAKLILIGTSYFPDRVEWIEWLNKHHKEDFISKRINKVLALEEKGAEVLVYTGDIANKSQIEEIIYKAENQFGKINGVFHAAGITDGNSFDFIGRMSQDQYNRHFRAKVYGLLTLENILQDKQIDFCIITSSLSSILGGITYAGYSAANNFMDYFVKWVNQNKQRPWISINWDSWKFDDADIQDSLQKYNFTPSEGIRVLQKVLELKSLNQIVISTGDLQLRMDQWLKPSTGKEEDTGGNKEKVVAISRPNLSSKYSAPNNDTERKLVKIWSEVLEVENIGIDDDFFELGGHSLKAIKLGVNLENVGIEIDLSKFYEYKTIRKIAEYINGVENDPSKKEQVDLIVKKSDNGMQMLKVDRDTDVTSNEIILKNIEPINDIFFKSCFYNSFFPVIRHFNRSDLPILVNDVIVYCNQIGDETANLDVDYLSTKPIEQVITEIGLHYSTKTISKDIIDNIIHSIDNDRCVIAWVDCFYISIRRDTYLKEHRAHTLLIYGYNKLERQFNVIEQLDSESLTYGKRILKFNDIVDAYEAYLNNFSESNPIPSYLEFFVDDDEQFEMPDSESDYAMYLENYLCNIKTQANAYIKQMNNLEVFIERFKALSTKQSILLQNSEIIINGLNNIINAKKVERYKIIKMFTSDFEGIKLLNDIIDNWTLIRSVVAKYSFTSVYKQKSFELAVSKLEQLYQLEKDYCTKILYFII